MAFSHIIIDWENRTYSVCDGVPSIEKTHGFGVDAMNYHLVRNQRNIIKPELMVLRAKKKNTIYKMDEPLDEQ